MNKEDVIEVLKLTKDFYEDREEVLDRFSVPSDVRLHFDDEFHVGLCSTIPYCATLLNYLDDDWFDVNGSIRKVFGLLNMNSIYKELNILCKKRGWMGVETSYAWDEKDYESRIEFLNKHIQKLEQS